MAGGGGKAKGITSEFCKRMSMLIWLLICTSMRSLRVLLEGWWCHLFVRLYPWQVELFPGPKNAQLSRKNPQTEVLLWVVKPFTLKISSSFIVIRCISSLKEFVGITMNKFFLFGPPIVYKWVGFQVTRKTDDSQSWQAAILQSGCSVASSIK